MGGGAATLTADLAARAIIASAQACGVDPVKACLAKGGRVRKALGPAAAGLAAALDEPKSRFVRLLGLRKSTASDHAAEPWFQAAQVAAMRAVEYALWQPEAAESVVGEDLPEVAGAPPADAIAADRPLRIPAAFDEPMLPAPRAAPDSMARAPVDFRASKALPAADRPVEDLVLEALAGGMALSSMSLASVIGRKEMAVSTALASLQARGQVVAEPVEAGPRKLAWRVAA